MYRYFVEDISHLMKKKKKTGKTSKGQISGWHKYFLKKN